MVTSASARPSGGGTVPKTDSPVDSPTGDAATADPPTDPNGIDPDQSAAVRSGWTLVDAHERLGISGAREIFGHEHDAWYDYATSTIANLEQWGGGAAHRSIVENDNNRLRYRRTLDFTAPGDRVFDVGFGRGYLLGILLRDAKVSAYHGVDVVERYLSEVQQLVAESDTGTVDIGLDVCDLYDLTHEQVAATDADFMICCEVLEHVPDAEAGLKVLADVLPDGADLLFSVPLFGRLESVWGHLSVFDVARLKSMVADAGLFVHHVEPVANTWTFVVASKNPEPSQRVRQARSRPAHNVSRPLTDQRVFRDVPPEEFTSGQWVNRTTCTVSQADDNRVRCDIVGSDPAEVGRSGQYGGVAFPVESWSAMRLELGLFAGVDIRRVFVDLYRGSDRVGRWLWKPTQKQRGTPAPKRHSLRPGESGRFFTSVETPADTDVDRVEVFALIEPGSQGSFTVKAAYLP